MNGQPVKQAPTEALFPDVLWNKPLNKQGAGKLLIAGGNKHRFFAPAQAQSVAQQVGAGTIKTLMPDATKKLVGKSDSIEFAPSNPSGSFAHNGLDVLLSLSQWSDAVLLAGDAGHNSETSLLVEKFLTSYDGQVTLTHDFVDMFVGAPNPVLLRENTLLVVTFSQLQKLAQKSEHPELFTYSMPLKDCLGKLREFSSNHTSFLITRHQDNLIFAAHGSVVYMNSMKETWRVEQATKSAVLWMQQPLTPFESITTSLLEIPMLESTV